MTGKELLDELLPSLLRIGPTEKNLFLYHEIKETLNDFQIIDFFQQIKKNDLANGLALEVMIFNKNLLHDIVVTSTTVDLMSILTDRIISTFVETVFEETKNENGEISIKDKLKLSITYGTERMLVEYITDIKRFKEINRINTNLLKTISQ